jgi:phenylacetate-CoA ligase
MAEFPFTSRAAIAESQLEQLRSLVADLFPANRFYTKKLNSVGITFDIACLEDFSKRFPFTTKGEIVADQNASPPFGTNLTFPLDHYTRFHQTSGTAGAPIRWLDTPESWDWMVENWMQILKAARARPADRVYFAFSFGPFIGFWLAFEAAARLGCLCIPGGGLSSVARARAIVDNHATVLCCTPTYALHLAEVAAAEKIDLKDSHVRTLLVAGEPGGSIPAVRAQLKKAWPNATVFDHHGMTEVGPVSYECSQREGVLHVLEPGYFPEIVVPANGHPAAIGALGELVLTPLGRLGSPLLRYRTGDLVKACPNDGPCACGTYDLALEGGILGRADDMVIVRGVNVYPGAIDQIVRSVEGIAEYQVELVQGGTLPEMTVRIEPTADVEGADQLTRQLMNLFETVLSLRVPVTAVPCGSLPRFEMKANRWQVRQSGRCSSPT